MAEGRIDTVVPFSVEKVSENIFRAISER